MPYFCWADNDGKEYLNKILRDFLNSINEQCGTKFDIDKSVSRRNSFIIFIDIPEKKAEAPVVEAKEPEIEEVVETVEEVETTAKVDIAYAKTLYNESSKRESKNTLETYALQFGYNLDKRNSFDGMIEELESLI